jgi:hypothetical protein
MSSNSIPPRFARRLDWLESTKNPTPEASWHVAGGRRQAPTGTVPQCTTTPKGSQQNISAATSPTPTNVPAA